MRKRRWHDSDLRKAVSNSRSFRNVLITLGLVPAGGNYQQIKETIRQLDIDVSHFTGRIWNKGKTIPRAPLFTLSEILVKNNSFQSSKLKKRLIAEGIKKPECEDCGWAKISNDGRLPLELDHKNGDRRDNRLENLRILCPNCHSLQPTHRGRNKGKHRLVI